MNAGPTATQTIDIKSGTWCAEMISCRRSKSRARGPAAPDVRAFARKAFWTFLYGSQRRSDERCRPRRCRDLDLSLIVGVDASLDQDVPHRRIEPGGCSARLQISSARTPIINVGTTARASPSAQVHPGRSGDFVHCLRRAVAGNLARDNRQALKVVRAEGLEPPQLSSLEPKSSASTNSATPARRITFGGDAASGGLITCAQPFAAKKWPSAERPPNHRCGRLDREAGT
jgi:hypothetical protein